MQTHSFLIDSRSSEASIICNSMASMSYLLRWLTKIMSVKTLYQNKIFWKGLLCPSVFNFILFLRNILANAQFSDRLSEWRSFNQLQFNWFNALFIAKAFSSIYLSYENKICIRSFFLLLSPHLHFRLFLIAFPAKIEPSEMVLGLKCFKHLQFNCFQT